MKIFLSFLWLLARIIALAAFAGQCIEKGGWYWIPAILLVLLAYDDFRQVNKLLEIE